MNIRIDQSLIIAVMTGGCTWQYSQTGYVARTSENREGMES